MLPQEVEQDDALADARLLGLELGSDDLLPGESGAVWREHQAAVEAFLSISTQWRVTGMADGKLFASGLDYGAVRTGLKLAGIKITKRLWAQIRMIEIGARRAMNGTT